MPKIRPAGASLADALKHLRVFQARLDNSKQHQEFARQINDATSTIQIVLKSFPIEENNDFTDEQINIATNLINKEQKKDKPKINPIEILKAIWATTGGKDMVKLQVEYGISQERLKAIVLKAPPNTTLGKIIAQMKPKIQSSIGSSQANTIDSEFGSDDDVDYGGADDPVLAKLNS